jgi:hypothetical protein
MADEEVPKLADWLNEYRSRPEPKEVVVASYNLVRPLPDDPREGMAAGQVGLDIVRYDAQSTPGPPNESHYVLGVSASGEHLWDVWYDSEESARREIESGRYGAVTERKPDAR